MLKVKFWRIENVVLMRVLEQGEEIKRGCGKFFSTTGFTLRSGETPDMRAYGIYVKGAIKSYDDYISTYICANCKEAKSYIARATEAIHAYNQSLIEESEQISDDIETVIVE